MGPKLLWVCRWLMSGLSQFVTAIYALMRKQGPCSKSCNKMRRLRHHTVTIRDSRDKPARQKPLIVGPMKTKAIYLTTTLLLTPTSLLFGDSASDELKLRYGNSSGNATLSVNQDISAGEHDMKASRNFLMNLELSEAQGALSVKIKGQRQLHRTRHDSAASRLKAGRSEHYIFEN